MQVATIARWIHELSRDYLLTLLIHLVQRLAANTMSRLMSEDTLSIF